LSMPKLRVLSGREVVKILSRVGFKSYLKKAVT